MGNKSYKKIYEKYKSIPENREERLNCIFDKLNIKDKDINDINNYKKTISTFNNEMAENALRVLAMAYKQIDHMPSKEEMKDIEKNLTFIGMVGMIDPPRK